MKSKNLILSFFFLCLIKILYGQAPKSNISLPDITIPSQETFALSRINYEPNSSGQFNYQYPVNSSTKIPVSLNYTSGVKVDDIGTSTGMSWQLNAGGAISRIVKDRVDEKNLNWKPTTVNEITDLNQIRSAANGNIDTEYDWFNYSISNGINGSFYIDHDLNVYIESGDKVKIEMFDRTLSGNAHRSLLEFILTDKSGNKYYFGGSVLNNEISTYTDRGSDRIAVTGWYLYKIETIDKKLINLTYTSENSSYYTSLNAGFSISPTCPPPFGDGNVVYSGVHISKSRNQFTKPRLSIISEDDREIKFNYDKERKDLINSNPSNNLLTSIEIKSNNKLINKYELDYFDIQKLPAETYYQLPYDEPSTTNRHFLKSVTQINNSSKTQFDYYNLELLPGRFSLNADYYGYANGAQNISPFPTINDNNNFGIFKNFNMVPQSMFSANKEVNPLLFSVGNLKKITHPTKGISEISYEPNSSMGLVNETVTSGNHLQVVSNKCNSGNNNHTASFTFESNGSFIEFDGSAYFDDTENCGYPDNLGDIHTLTLTDQTIMGNNLVIPGNWKISVPFIAADGTNNYAIPTQNGHIYKAEYSVSSKFGVVRGSIDFKFNKRTESSTKLIYFGGSRVSSISESDLQGNTYTKKIYYNKFSEILSQVSSIVDYSNLFTYADIQNTALTCSGQSGFPSFPILPVYSASQNSIVPMYNHRRNNVFYKYVTEVIENKSAIERQFSYEDNTEPYIGRAPEIYYLPKSNYGEMKSNLLMEENIYRFENGAFSKSSNTVINYDFTQIKSKKSYVFRQNFMYYPLSGEEPLLNISYGYYENFYGFHKPTSSTLTDYVNGIPLTTTTQYFYINPSHYQITSQRTEFPDLSLQETTYSYAHEKGKTDMITANMIGIPLVTEVKKFKDSSDGNPKTISKSGVDYIKRIIGGKELILPDVAIIYDLQSLSASTEIKYNEYDDKGNILQYNLKPDSNGNGGIPTTIIWGYNQTQPIAKIEGATYSQIMPYITDIVFTSNSDAFSGTSFSEQDLIDKLDVFRKISFLENFQITTYTYDPLIGVRSITPPSGIRENYIYDTANRLQSVKDNNGNILKEYDYKYKP